MLHECVEQDLWSRIVPLELAEVQVSPRAPASFLNQVIFVTHRTSSIRLEDVLRKILDPIIVKRDACPHSRDHRPRSARITASDSIKDAIGNAHIRTTWVYPDHSRLAVSAHCEI